MVNERYDRRSIPGYGIKRTVYIPVPPLWGPIRGLYWTWVRTLTPIGGRVFVYESTQIRVDCI